MLAEDHSICDVVHWSYGIEKACMLKIEYNERLFHISLSPDARLANTVQGLLLQKFDNAQRSGDDDEEEEVMEEIADVVCLAGLPHFSELAPPKPQRPLLADLYSFLHPESFYFQLVTINGRAQIVRQDNPGLNTQLFFSINIGTSALPTFAMRDIQVLKKLRGSYITKVLVEGQERCCKISNNMTQAAVQREFDCLSQVMAAANIKSPFRVPKLVGLIHAPGDHHNGQVVGIIEEFIDSAPGYSTLQRTGRQNVSESQKRKWAEQVRRTVEDLHQIGVVWGDGKTDNVLLDVNEDAWLIDFGGGWTQNWVDENLAGTVEGDMQAVQKIERFLAVGGLQIG